MSLDTYFWWIFIVANAVNLLSAAMFITRVRLPERTGLFGNLALLMGLPAAILAVLGMANQVGLMTWLMPLLYAGFSVFGLLVDVILKIEFRQPRRPAILVPFLLLFFISLIGMWGMLWNLGVLPWAITGLTYFAMVGASFYALGKGVG